ncbi:barstar family protein [Actinoplanes sp. NPDC049681]|uniref:barstar family protein n=1 Tax=Actinoplanes sp. NPDC049681 TaxID=3363905 RepID=UPI0037B12F05
MGTERPWVRGELPWLRSGPLFRVHRSAFDDLDAYLDRFPYRRFRLDGRAMTSRLEAHGEIARTFGFPDHYGRNWDAFEDCFGDFLALHSGELIAIVWDHLDVTAREAPATAAEVGWALLNGSRQDVALDLFGVGEGDDFDCP